MKRSKRRAKRYAQGIAEKLVPAVREVAEGLGRLRDEMGERLAEYVVFPELLTKEK